MVFNKHTMAHGIIRYFRNMLQSTPSVDSATQTTVDNFVVSLETYIQRKMDAYVKEGLGGEQSVVLVGVNNQKVVLPSKRLQAADTVAYVHGGAVVDNWLSKGLVAIYFRREGKSMPVEPADEEDVVYMSLERELLAMVIVKPIMLLLKWSNANAAAKKMIDGTARLSELSKYGSLVQSAFSAIAEALLITETLGPYIKQETTWVTVGLNDHFGKLKNAMYELILESVTKQIDALNEVVNDVFFSAAGSGDATDLTYVQLPAKIEQSEYVHADFEKRYGAAISSKTTSKLKVIHTATHSLKKSVQTTHCAMLSAACLKDYEKEVKTKSDAAFSSEDHKKARVACAYTQAVILMVKKPKAKDVGRAQQILDCPKTVLDMLSPKMRMMMMQLATHER